MRTDVDIDAEAEAGSAIGWLRALADPLRWSILQLLKGEELCVCHLVEALDAPQSLVSHHLRVLRQAGLVQSERFRYWTYYRPRPGALAALAAELGALAADVPSPGARRRPCC